jgi:hypothetical protein
MTEQAVLSQEVLESESPEQKAGEERTRRLLQMLAGRQGLRPIVEE